MADEATSTQGDTATEETTEATVLGGDEQTQDQQTQEGGETKAGEETGEKAEGEKKDEKPVVPEKYEFKVEGMELDAKAVEAYSPVFKELGLTQEQAQKLVDVHTGFLKQQQADVEQFYAGMKAEAQKIPAEQIGLAKKALKMFGDEAKPILEDAYMGNNPALIKFLAKFGGLVSEGKFHEGRVTDPAAKSLADKLYSKM